MEVRVELQETTFELKEAILIYKESGYGSRRTLASVHGISGKAGQNGRPQIGPGRPITEGDIISMTKKLGRAEEATYLPKRVVVSTTRTLIWYRPPERRALFFDAKDEDLNELSGSVFPHPGLVFRLTKSPNGKPRMSVWAKRQLGRPKPDLILYHAPYFNVSKRGSLCHGSMHAPKEATPTSIDAWEDAFFQSAFTHGSGTRFLEGSPGYTRTMKALAGTEARFPTRRLVKTGQRLTDIIK